jgi:hypothetical protein
MEGGQQKIRAKENKRKESCTGFQGHFWILKRAPKKFFPKMLATGGERKIFPWHTIPKLHVFDQMFLKTSKLPNKKGTFDVNLVFTATY